MKTILVTGGAGFIGSNFIKYILGKYPYRVINLDLLTYAGNSENIKGLAKSTHYTFVKGDVANRALVSEVFDKYTIDCVVHMAAESHVDRSIEDPEVFIRTNVLGTQVLLDVAKEHWQTGRGVEGYPVYRDGVRFLQVSTDEVYGALGKTGKFTESSPIQPNSPYASSKAAADLMVRSYNKTYRLPTIISRCSNNYGPFQYPEKLIPLMIHNAINDQPLPVYGDGMQIRDWLHVSDHCSAIDKVLHEGATGEVYNIGGDCEKANIEIVRLILKSLGKSEELITYVEDRLGHDRRYAIDNSKITSQLGWQPQYSFEQGMLETITWYQENTEWLSKVQERL